MGKAVKCYSCKEKWASTYNDGICSECSSVNPGEFETVTEETPHIADVMKKEFGWFLKGLEAGQEDAGWVCGVYYQSSEKELAAVKEAFRQCVEEVD